MLRSKTIPQTQIIPAEESDDGIITAAILESRLLETKDLSTRKLRLEQILKTYTLDDFSNKTLQESKNKYTFISCFYKKTFQYLIFSKFFDHIIYFIFSKNIF